MKMEADIGGMCLQAKETRRGSERVFGGSATLLTPWSYITESATGLWFEEKLLSSLLCLRLALLSRFSFPPRVGSGAATGNGAASPPPVLLDVGPSSRELEKSATLPSMKVISESQLSFTWGAGAECMEAQPGSTATLSKQKQSLPNGSSSCHFLLNANEF